MSALTGSERRGEYWATCFSVLSDVSERNPYETQTRDLLVRYPVE